MNRIEKKLKELSPSLFGKLNETREEVKLLLDQYLKNFPEYTDHSIHHTTEVFNIVDEILTDEELENLNSDEIYILSMSSFLHDIGMCIPEEKISIISDTEDLIRERELNPELSKENYLRNIHHNLSRKFILEEWETLKIPNQKYAEAIGLVSEGHRIVELENPEIYKPKFFVKTGRDFVCLPYLASILRIADELDITNIRTPRLLTKYYMPDNAKSVLEWNKHIANTIRNVTENYVRFEVYCSNNSMLASLEDQFSKIKNVITYCQKVIRNISNTENRKFSLKLDQVKEEYKFIDFDPKGIKYSFDVESVINAFIGENLYNDKLTSLREVIQNSIDTCRYKKILNQKKYIPKVKISIFKDKIVIEDNGFGMDEFIVKNFFSKLGSSFYQQDNVKKDYEAIGQFGVGVFSYFLMAQYIDIETKTDESNPLHFRLDKDPKNYFHFFNDSKIKNSGTKITLYLKDEFKNYDGLIFLNYIKNKFKYIEFPIEINLNDEIEILKKESFEIDNLQNLIKESLKYSYKNKFKNIKYHTINFNNDDYEGSCTFLYTDDLVFNNVFSLLNEDNKIFNKKRHYNSLTEICQKGVLIGEFEEFSLLDTIIKINLKKKINIQISRNAFSNKKEIQQIIDEINKKLIISLFNLILTNTDVKKIPKIIYNYNLKTFRRFENNFYSKELYNIFYIKLISKKNENFINLTDFFKLNYNEIIISLNENHTNLIIKEFENYEDLNIVELFVSDKEVFMDQICYKTYLNILSDNEYENSIVKKNNIYFNKFIKKEKLDLKEKKFLNYYFIETENIDSFNTEIFYLSKKRVDIFIPEMTTFNFNHPFSNQLFNKINQDDITPELNSLFKELFELIRIGNVQIDKQKIKEINNIILEIGKYVNLNFTFKVKDF